MSAPRMTTTAAMMPRVIQSFLRDRFFGGFVNIDCVMNFGSEMELTAEPGEGCRVQENGAPTSAGASFPWRIGAPACPLVADRQWTGEGAYPPLAVLVAVRQ